MPNHTRPEREVRGGLPGYAYAGSGVHTATGNFTRSETDLPMPDALLSWWRTYNSRAAHEGGPAPGWTHALSSWLEPVGPGAAGQDVPPDAQEPEPRTEPPAVVLHDPHGRALTFRRREDGSYERPQDIDADLYDADDGWVLRWFHGETWEFGTGGSLLALRDDGRSVTLHYEHGRLGRAVHSTGRRLELEYGEASRLTSVTSDDGRSVRYVHDDGGRLREVRAPGGATTVYASDDEGRITRVTDPDGVVLLANSYDEHGRVARQELAGAGALHFAYEEHAADDRTPHGRSRTTVTHEPSGAESVYVHGPDHRTVRATDALGHTSTMAYDADGRLVRAELPGSGRLERVYEDGALVSATVAGSTTRYRYDAHRRPTELTGPVGDTTRYGYEGSGHLPTTVTGPDGSVTRFEVRDGLIVSRSGPSGDTVRYTYDGLRNLVEETAADGRRTRYGYDDAGRRNRIEEPTGESTTLTFDDAGRPVAVTGSDGTTVTRTWSAAGRLLDHSDAEGERTVHRYDSAGRLVSRTDREGLETTYEYDTSGRPAGLVQPDGVRVTARFDAVGRVVAVDQPDAGTTAFTYDAAGNRTAVRTPQGTSSATYDERGNPVSVTAPGGATTTFAYDAADRLTGRTDPSGAHWGIAYGTAHRTLTRTGPDGARSTEIRDADGRTTATIDALGRRTEYRHDADGHVREVVDPEGGRTRFVRDGLGRAVARTTPAGLTTRFEYRDGRLVAVTDPRGWITRYRYDRNGRRTRVITPSGATTCYAYNKRGALTRVTDPRGGVTTYSYDARGNLTKVVDAKGVATTYAYDRAGRRVSVTDPLGRTTRRAFDAQGRLASVTSPAGDTVHFAYDEAGLLVRRWTDEGDEVGYTYDHAGRRTAMRDSSGTTRYAYDAYGRLTSVTWPSDATYRWEYDAAGQLRTLTYPDGAHVHYRFDLNGRLAALRDSQAGEAVYAVDPDGRLLTEQLPGGWARRYAYEGGLLSSFSELRSGGVRAAHVTLTRDSEGRIVRHEEDGVVREFAYDPVGQLVAESLDGPGGRTRTDLGYDIAGNRTMTVTDGTATRCLYDAADQLTAVETAGRHIRYGYDGAGRLVDADDGELRQHLTYNGFHHPVRAVTSRAWAVERTDMEYNGDGFLVHWRNRTGDDDAPHTDVRYQWTTGDAVPQILHQQVRTDVPQSSNTAPPGRDLATARFTYGYARTFATTAHGSVNFARDAYGSAVPTRATLPWVQDGPHDGFGAAAGAQPLPEPHLSARIPRFGYRGELGFGPVLNLRARHYDTTLGRFTTRDPVSVLGAGTLRSHPYVYALNDPLNRTDPQGTWSTPVPAAAQLVGSVLRQAATGCSGCGNPGNGIESHKKCFQGRTCLHTRGYFTEEQLDADHDALVDLWHSGRKEAMGHAMALYELNGRKQGFWRGLGEDLGMGRAISEDVDWEVGTRSKADPPPWFRIDILVDEENMLEVKQYKGGAAYWEVEQQLDSYLLNGAVLNLVLHKGKDLEDWADSIDVITGLHWPWSEEIVYVWGMGNTAGHIYLDKDDDDRLNDEMKGRADDARREREHKQSMQDPFFPLPIPIRVPPVVPV
ncbi:RHS repeat-associated core domain-containing protein [Streptomyces cacaoi]|uniref:Type IV secretion protein Rhs n=1 Tax=Streptomyces cacaoi TaxID=1898 RepID=A0A4Y3R3K7_STRCI|nr:RHS repeat-associated core domain-containing protein [Streptomyces cacaoi]NNG87203.1 hypothetical protein [Streptomyces cacaoi]GEB52094.1 hypothetical protein SCA03_46450 [Streptomyces cacaoi]